jgi:hypothetical protein
MTYFILAVFVIITVISVVDFCRQNKNEKEVEENSDEE